MHMSPALNGRSAIQRFEGSNAIEIRNEITFDFYMGLPHLFILNKEDEGMDIGMQGEGAGTYR